MIKRTDRKKKARWGLLRRNEDGVVAVEFALTAVPFFMLIFGIFEMGQLLWASSQIDFHADRIIRSAAVDSSVTNGQIQASIEAALDDLDPSGLVISISRDAGSTATPDILNVRISYTHTPVTPFLFDEGVVLSHSSRYPMLDN